MDKIIIKNTCNADSRTSDGNLTRQSLLDATNSHKYDVERGMEFLAEKLLERGVEHDWSKIEYFDEFAENVLKLHTDLEFKESDWYQKHISEERHHLNSECPLDVNLIDVLEMIVDCVMAGKGRSGKTTPSYLLLNDPNILIRAYYNTIILLDQVVEVSNGENLL